MRSALAISLTVAYRPVSRIFFHRNARAIALTSVLSTCGAKGGTDAPSGASTSLRPPRLHTANGTLMVTTADSGAGIRQPSGARRRWRQALGQRAPAPAFADA